MTKMFDRVFSIRSGNHAGEYKFTVRHLPNSSTRKGNTILIMDLPEAKDPVFMSTCDKNDFYDRKKGILTCIQKFIWKAFQDAIWDIDSFMFFDNGYIEIEIVQRKEEDLIPIKDRKKELDTEIQSIEESVKSDLNTLRFLKDLRNEVSCNEKFWWTKKRTKINLMKT